MKETGLGMTLAALIDATIIRTLLELVAPWPQAPSRAADTVGIAVRSSSADVKQRKRELSSPAYVRLCERLLTPHCF